MYKNFIVIIFILLYGCAGVGLNVNYSVSKDAVSNNFNNAIYTNNIILSKLINKENNRSLSKINYKDLNEARAKQSVMFDRAKKVIAVGHVDKAELIKIWSISVDSYVDTKKIIDKDSSTYSADVKAMLKVYNNEVVTTSEAIEKQMLSIGQDNLNATFRLIMDQAYSVNKMILLILSN